MKPSENAEIFELTGATYWYDESGILCGIGKQFQTRTREEAILLMDQLKNITKGKRVCFLFDGTLVPAPGNEARKHYAVELPKIIKAMAVLSNSMFGKLVANIFFTLHPPSYPAKMFTDEQEALEWLKQFNDFSNKKNPNLTFFSKQWFIIVLVGLILLAGWLLYMSAVNKVITFTLLNAVFFSTLICWNTWYLGRMENRRKEFETANQSSEQFIVDDEKRMNKILDALLNFTQLDFSQKMDISEKGDLIDSFAIGLNTLTEEFENHIQKLKDTEEKINSLNKDLQQNIINLEMANKELDAFSYSVSHDLRAPLRAIHGYTHILLEDHAGNLNEEAKQMMQSVVSNTAKMGQLIDDLLSFSRMAKTELKNTTIDMTELAQAVLKDAMPAPKSTIVIHPLLPAFADYNLISLVVANLLSNAIKYSQKEENPSIEINSYSENNENIYFVKDNGVGFDMKYNDKLFGVFQRLHSSSEFEGTGVGLAIVKRIIKRHGGKVWAESQTGAGATFYFSLNKQQ